MAAALPATAVRLEQEDVLTNEVLLDVTGGVARITINREARRNAISPAVTAIMADMLEQVADRSDIRAVVLTGAGDRAFCAGADLSPGSGSFEPGSSRGGSPYVRLLKTARALPQPLIARVNGHCMAGGMGLLGMSDMAVAVDTARFGLPEVKIGVFPMMVTSVLRDLVPPRRYRELSLTGEPISAMEALEAGLLNYVTTAKELDAKVDWLLGRLLDKSPTGIRRGKAAMNAAEPMPFDDALNYFEEQIDLLALTEDAKEGRAAFNEKRAPVWTGA